MKKFIQDFKSISNEKNDLGSFWLRKSGKPVLAVLLVKKPGESLKLYRGTNVEVSMPTGSLCAERNAIGTALAADMSLRRQDLRAVAVYAAPSVNEAKSMSKDSQGPSALFIDPSVRLGCDRTQSEPPHPPQ